MSRKLFLISTLLVNSLFAGASMAAEDPTLHQVYDAANAGHLVEAQTMMAQVLRDHPNSAKAHYVDAEILAKEGQLANAKSELNTAERLAPGLPFAKPESVGKLKQLVSGNIAPAMAGAYTAPHQGSTGISWPVLLVGIALIIGIIMFVRSLRRGVTVMPGGNNYGPGYGPGAPMQPYGGGGYAPPMGSTVGGMGSGILGGLATGAAVGAGMVAGEELMHHFTDGNRQDSNPMPSGNWDAVPDDMGGSDFGISDGSSWDDSSSGGGDW